MRTGYPIRRYKDADHSPLIQFLGLVLSSLGHQFDLDGKDSDIRDLQQVYLHAHGSFHVADHDAQIVGSVGIRRCSPEIAELKRFYVGKEHRGIGLGADLCATAIDEAKALGYQWMRLDTTLRAEAALALFRKIGFYEIPRYNDDPYADIWMERAL